MTSPTSKKDSSPERTLRLLVDGEHSRTVKIGSNNEKRCTAGPQHGNHSADIVAAWGREHPGSPFNGLVASVRIYCDSNDV